MKTISVNIFLSVLMVLPCYSQILAQSNTGHHFKRTFDSGGLLIREQASYDVKFYKINIKIDTATHSIVGEVLIRAIAVDTLSTFVLDLASSYIIDSVRWIDSEQKETGLPFALESGKIWISLSQQLKSQDTISIMVSYHGFPKVSINPPWDPGFVWKRTPTGEIWAGVVCEKEGADLWWPCKDHPSDEPDSVDLFFTVPSSLTCVSNGRLVETIEHESSKTFHWFVSEPINNYSITFYLGPYIKSTITYQSVTGEMVPSEYWFLPHKVEMAKLYSTTFLKDMRFLEEVCGPFPFRAEKYGLVDAPYWGMEHQTVIAYGNNFALNVYGFDYIHLHELAHEWWGNLITAKDWSDVWLHEGFATYMEPLFVDRTLGVAKYKSYMATLRNTIRNEHPVAPLEPASAQKMFATNDIYNKGAWILHTLRHYLGDETFFRIVRKIAYPDSVMESVTDGKQCRFVTTNDVLEIAEQQSKLDLDWFFNVYLRQPALPKLQYGRNDTLLTLMWIVPESLPFALPVDIQVGAETIRVEMHEGFGSVKIPQNTGYKIDPDGWILMEPPRPMNVSNERSMHSFALDVYPNPFNSSTTIRYVLPRSTSITVKIFDILGREVAILKNGMESGGQHELKWDATHISGGIYICRIQADNFVGIRKLLLLK